MSIIDLITIDVYQNYCNNCIIKSEEKKGDTFRTCLKIYFFPYHDEIWRTRSSQWVFIFTKFYEDRTKIVNL